MRRRHLLLGLALASCGAPTLPKDASIVLSRSGDARVGAYVSKPWGFETVSYWIEGPEGLVLVDTQFLLSAATEAVDWAERTTGKKVVAAIVLHANPDKFNGTKTLQDRGIRVMTSAQVLALIPHVHAIRTAAFYDRYKPDYPTEAPKPESFGDTTREITLAGLPMKLHVMGAGCSEAHVVLEWNKHVFVGDLVGNGTHAWLELGLVQEWMKRLDEIAALAPQYVHPGRGPSGGAELLAFEKVYLQYVLETVQQEKASKDAEEGIQRAKARIKERFPLSYDVFLDVGLGAVWKASVR